MCVPPCGTPYPATGSAKGRTQPRDLHSRLGRGLRNRLGATNAKTAGVEAGPTSGNFPGSERGRTDYRPLPHHRTCGFPHPAVEPGGVRLPRSRMERGIHRLSRSCWQRHSSRTSPECTAAGCRATPCWFGSCGRSSACALLEVRLPPCGSLRLLVTVPGHLLSNDKTTPMSGTRGPTSALAAFLPTPRMRSRRPRPYHSFPLAASRPGERRIRIRSGWLAAKAQRTSRDLPGSCPGITSREWASRRRTYPSPPIPGRRRVLTQPASAGSPLPPASSRGTPGLLALNQRASA